MRKTFSKILVANRGEIAIRIFRAATELQKSTVAVFTREDRFSLHRFKADESYLVGEGMKPIAAYLAMENIISIARECGADAIHPGYGFLAENPEFCQLCDDVGIAFIGPSVDSLRTFGDKLSARAAACAAGVPVLPATGALDPDRDNVEKAAHEVGYPLMLKANWGGGGRGMRAIYDETELEAEMEAGLREARAAFGHSEVFLERLVKNARHLEVQVIGDQYGNLVHLFERDCSVQRRNQKIIERAPAPDLSLEKRQELSDLAIKLIESVGYSGAGTVEFLHDADADEFFFIEVNPRIQVEHTVTEEVTGIDIVKAQIRIAEGAEVGSVEDSGVPAQSQIVLRGHAIQCRITTEDPANSFIPDYGRITAYRGATGFGIRLDGGTAYSGAVISRHYDSLLEKITAWAPSPSETIDRMIRALREFRIRGVATNLSFLENLVGHSRFRSGKLTTRFIDESDELFAFSRHRDRATRLLSYLADVMVNGHAELADREGVTRAAEARVPEPDIREGPVSVSVRDRLLADGPDAVAGWMRNEQRLLVTDTTMRDAHQSLLATRMRTADMLRIAPAYARELPVLFSVECWGGATFDTSMRFLDECPWERLRALREAMPNLLLQALVRGSNGVGYTTYPDNVIERFTTEAAEAGIDLFRVFDSLNWIESMKVSVESVLATGALCEAAICYTGDISRTSDSIYTLEYYLGLAHELKALGTHILGIKDMAGLMTPAVASVLIPALREETGLPVHFHTHDTSGIGVATILAASEAGVDAVDLSFDSFSGLTSQPCMGAVVKALTDSARETGLCGETIQMFSRYWGDVREEYHMFESPIRAPDSEVWRHEMPGGQMTNLQEQARTMDLLGRWNDISRTYAEINQAFGDIPKVTPSSKVVGDMTLALLSAGLSANDMIDPDREISFPDSVVSFFRGDLGQPPAGFPKALQSKVLKGEMPITVRPGSLLPPADPGAMRAELSEKLGDVTLSENDVTSYILYPKVYLSYRERRIKYGPLIYLPTDMYFFGMFIGEERNVSIDQGKSLVIRCLAVGETDSQQNVRVFFELNGQPRTIRVVDRRTGTDPEVRMFVDPANVDQVGAPMPGLITSVSVKPGSVVAAGDALFSIEAMKMESAVYSERAGTIEFVLEAGAQVETKELVARYVLTGDAAVGVDEVSAGVDAG